MAGRVRGWQGGLEGGRENRLMGRIVSWGESTHKRCDQSLLSGGGGGGGWCGGSGRDALGVRGSITTCTAVEGGEEGGRE